jgi:type II secretory pathway component GspD/PulD (secretin)
MLGRLFSREGSNVTVTETIVLITPRLVGENGDLYGQDVRDLTERNEQAVLERARTSEAGIRLLLDRGGSASVTEPDSD